MKSLLLLCEGNICRSPMAEALFRLALPKFQVRSAGLSAVIGRPADETASRIMAERGIDISGHRAQELTRTLCLESDLVLVMDADQKHRVEALFPQSCGRVFRLAEHLKLDIPDPYRQGEIAFRNTLNLIDRGTTEWRQRIQRL